jgi:hypothetical protein
MGLDEKGTIQKFTKGLPQPLHRSIVDREVNIPTTWQDWTNAAVRHQQKWLYLQSVFKGTPKVNPQGNRPNRPNLQQWRQGFAKDPHAMDLTPGRTRARATLTEEERAQLMTEGKCFRCKQQGHMSRNCPSKPKPAQARAGNSEEAEVQIAATNTATNTPKKFNAKEMVENIKQLGDEDKDLVIQEVFMGKDFS